METPIPNFFFMGVQFLHLLALSVWVGGIIFIRVIMAPTLFKSLPSLQMAESFVSEISKKFNDTTLFCAVILITTGMIKFWRWENLTPWNLIRYIAIFVMTFSSLYMALNIYPQKQKEVSFSVSEEGKELDVKSSKRHHLDVLADRLTMLSLVCGLTALLVA